MADSFIGEIRMFPFDFAPIGWAVCDGQILRIDQNQALYSLLGTRYGGNGTTTFALPNLLGRVPIHFDDKHPLGASGGESGHVLTVQELPPHAHSLAGVNAAATSPNPAGASFGVPAAAVGATYATSRAKAATMHVSATIESGSSQAHSNLQPYLTLVFCIALQGNYPPRN